MRCFGGMTFVTRYYKPLIMKLLMLYETNGKNRLLCKMLMDVGYLNEIKIGNRKRVLAENCVYAENTTVRDAIEDIRNIIRNANMRNKYVSLRRCLFFKYS